ncbi:MAG: hypothetical protein NE330_04945 [Lentisphaeraceae bacterium]|nr:hypothetical protein [Lentisphaeraceae bacterium]
MSSIEGKVCLNHTNIPAVARCTSCMKPVCQECVVNVNSDNFCSDTCAENHIRTSADINRFKSKQKSGVMKKVIILAILAALAWFGWTKKEEIKQKIDEKKEELKNQ